MKRVLFALLLAATACACSKAADHAPTSSESEQGAPAIDTDVMAYLSAARALHHEADLREDARDTQGAIAAMERLVALPKPHPSMRVVEVEEVLADAYARMAELRLKTGDLDRATRDVESGLDHAQDPTYFRGHLLEVDGIVEKAHAMALADAGQKDDAERARQKAIALLQEAVRVQEQVITKALPDAGSTPAASASGR